MALPLSIVVYLYFKGCCTVFITGFSRPGWRFMALTSINSFTTTDRNERGTLLSKTSCFPAGHWARKSSGVLGTLPST